LEQEADWKRGPLHAPLLRLLLETVPELEARLRELRGELDGAGPSGAAGAELRDRIRDAGWVLGVLAAAEGTDILHARRERRGVRILAPLVGELLARRGRTLAGPTGVPAELPPEARDWQLAWAVAGALFAAGGEGPDRTSWSFRREEDRLVLLWGAPAGPALRDFAASLGEGLPGARLEESRGRSRLVLAIAPEDRS
jgi:hypothetical protein